MLDCVLWAHSRVGSQLAVSGLIHMLTGAIVAKWVRSTHHLGDWPRLRHVVVGKMESRKSREQALFKPLLVSGLLEFH